ncbi:MAG TPA: class I SAM-dependent methyltransferase [Terriglobia bacterium]|nr:class I SAM-dependent methyltransferase [Terriglobia bacterium]
MVRFIASQLRRPHGWFGSLVLSPVMNRVNGQIVESTLALLQLRPEHQVLEIGFGGGLGLRRLARLLAGGRATGVDISPDVVRDGERSFRREIAAGRLRILGGEVSKLPFSDAEFDRVFTVNTIYFWPDTLQGLGEIRRVLKNGGLAAVGLRSREKMEKHAVSRYNFRLFSAEEVAGLMKQAGFRDIKVQHRDQDRVWDEVIVTGRR